GGRPILHHATAHGRVHVRAVVDRHAGHAFQPASEDDELHHAARDAAAFLAVRGRLEPLLCRTEFCGPPATMAVGKRASAEYPWRRQTRWFDLTRPERAA